MSNKVFKRVAATLLAVLLLFYVGLQIYNSNHSSIQTETATYMTASDTIETTGYIVRNETYLTSDAGGVLNYVLEDGESVKETALWLRFMPAPRMLPPRTRSASFREKSTIWSGSPQRRIKSAFPPALT